MDTSNICCIVEKFFCDALVQEGKLADDNYLYVKQSTYLFGEIDKTNPRCDIVIRNTHETVSEPERN